MARRRAILALSLLAALAATAAVAQPADQGAYQALNNLTGHITRVWRAPCDTEHGRLSHIDIRFTLSLNGRVSDGPTWTNRSGDPDEIKAADAAIAAVNQGQPYGDLPDGLYNVPISITFDAETACSGRDPRTPHL